MKRLLSLLLTAVLLVSVLTVLPISIGAETSAEWNPTTVPIPSTPTVDTLPRNYRWYTPSGGTEAAPYEIADAADWAGLVDLSLGLNTDKSGQSAAVSFHEKYFVLTGNIDLTGYTLSPIGGNGTVYLDGRNHTVSHATTALFDTLGRRSLIANITFDWARIEENGAAAILALNAKAGLICHNLHILNTCSVKGSDITGGLIASLVDNENVTKQDAILMQLCINEADVTGADCVGGLIGNLQGSFDYLFNFCVNKGSIRASSVNTNACALGGIFGNFSRRSNDYINVGTITNCYNTGKLISAAAEDRYLFMGGIFGCLRAGISSEVTMVNCLDYSARSDPYATSVKHRQGGVFGMADNAQLIKIAEHCYAVNAPDSENFYTAVTAWTMSATAMLTDCAVLESLDDEILSTTGEPSTVRNEMKKLDAIIGHLRGDGSNHIYAIACDPDCDICGEERVVSHSYRNDAPCDPDCDLCGAPRSEVAAHSYDNEYDVSCNLCDALRTALPHTHQYASDCDAVCELCGETTRTPAHVYSHDMDRDCDLCGELRSVGNNQKPSPEPKPDQGGFEPITLPTWDEDTEDGDNVSSVIGGCTASLGVSAVALTLLCALLAGCVCRKKETE